MDGLDMMRPYSGRHWHFWCRCRVAGQMDMSLGGQPAAPPASRLRQPPCPARTGPLGCALDSVMQTHPVALRCVVLRAVGDLGLAVVQDTPDDGDAGHVLPAANQVLGLLKGHDPAGCKEPGTGQGPWPQSLLSPRPPSGPARPRLQEFACHPSLGKGRGRGWKSLPGKVDKAGTVSN